MEDPLGHYKVKEFYQCPQCNKKYKTPNKFEKHMTEQHPFFAFNKNQQTLSLEDKFYLLDCLEDYSDILTQSLRSYPACITENIDELIVLYYQNAEIYPMNPNTRFVGASIKLLPGNPSPSNPSTPNPSPTDIKRMVENHLIFRQRIIESYLLNKILSSETNIFLAFEDFEKFLNLGRPWKGGNFCPSLIIDLIWHSAMMNPEKYANLCSKFVGSLLTHCLPENEGKHEKRFEEFTKQFSHDHNRPCLQVGDLILGGGNGLANARETLKLQKAAKEKGKAEELEKERIWNEKYLAEIAEQKRNGTYVHYRGDGKC